MCECCSADTIDIAEIAEGWILVQARKDGNYMKKGEYALANFNDPDFYFDVVPVEDPTRGFSDDELDGMTAEEDKKWDEFDEIAEKIGKQLVTDPATGHMFYEACLKSGYDRELHGFFSYWLTDVMAIAIKTHHLLPHNVQESQPSPS